ncbi:MAG: hypothetical protein ABI833_12990 [Acidobacteriota bacterium]
MFPSATYPRISPNSRLLLGLLSRRSATLLSLLVVYLAIAWIGSSRAFKDGDEGGYAAYAMRIAHVPVTQNLLQWWGIQNPRYWWGPGYPLILAPLARLGWPWLDAKLLNAFFLAGAIAYAGAVINRYSSGATWMAVTLCLGLYPPLLRELPTLSPECLMAFLVCGFMFHFCALFQETRRFRPHLFAASAYLAYLALTKVFFGYAIATILMVTLVWQFWQRTQPVRTASGVFLLAMLWCVPYLCYMYSVTGKVFYWGTSGGSTLYWLSSTYQGEYGTWYSSNQVQEQLELAPHRAFFASLNGLTDVEQDDAFKKQAAHNIASHPKEYARNWAANVGRLLFSYPSSFASQSLTTYLHLAPNMFIFVLFLVSLIPAALRPQAMPFELWILLAFALIALGGFTLVSGYDRQFRPLVEIFCVWVALVTARVLRIELHPQETK